MSEEKKKIIVATLSNPGPMALESHYVGELLEDMGAELKIINFLKCAQVPVGQDNHGMIQMTTQWSNDMFYPHDQPLTLHKTGFKAHRVLDPERDTQLLLAYEKNLMQLRAKRSGLVTGEEAQRSKPPGLLVE